MELQPGGDAVYAEDVCAGEADGEVWEPGVEGEGVEGEGGGGGGGVRFGVRGVEADGAGVGGGGPGEGEEVGAGGHCWVGMGGGGWAVFCQDGSKECSDQLLYLLCAVEMRVQSVM